MRVQIPGETRQDYRYLLGLTLSQIMFLLIGGALGLQVYKSNLSLNIQVTLWVILAILTFMFAFVKYPVRGGEPFWVWLVRFVHFGLLKKQWVYGEDERPRFAKTGKPTVPIARKITQPLAIPVHPFTGPIRIARDKKPLVAEIGDVKLVFSRKGRDVFVTIQKAEE